jgi:hypothetical protein
VCKGKDDQRAVYADEGRLEKSPVNAMIYNSIDDVPSLKFIKKLKKIQN